MGPKASLDAATKRKTPCPCRESIVGMPNRNLVTILTELFRCLLKVKVKMSPDLTKYRAMKTSPLLNEVPHHKDAWGSESIAPLILNLGARWR
jgi:hypothetical protein